MPEPTPTAPAPPKKSAEAESKTDRIYRRGKIGNFIWPVSHHIITSLAAVFGFLIFKVFNRTVVIGREHVPHKPNTLIISNHQSMIDSFLVGMLAFFPKAFIKSSLIPWNPAAEENFFSPPLLGWFSDNWKCIPIKKGRRDSTAIYKMSKALKESPMTLFPEGTRTRDGSIGKARGGAGILVLENQPVVVPVCIDGMRDVLPIGAYFPRFFKKVYVVFGEPVDLSEFYAQEKSRRAAKLITDKIMARVQELQDEIQVMKQK